MSKKYFQMHTAQAKDRSTFNVNRGDKIYTLSQVFLPEILTTRSFLWAGIAIENLSKLSR